MLELTPTHWLEILALAWREYPLECCALLVGEPGGDRVRRVVPITNEAASSRVYRLHGGQFARASLDADDDGLDIIGVLHSHTHTAAFPSPTDVSQATKPLVPPTWHWAIVSLGWQLPELRSYRISAENGIDEEPVGFFQ